MLNEKITIRILFEGEIQNIICYCNWTIQEIIHYYVQNYLDSTYNINNFRLKINGKKCALNSNIASYINDINNTLTFELKYNDSEEEDDDEEVDNDIIKENYIQPLNMEINIEFFKTDKNIFSGNYNGDLFGLLKLCLLKEIAKKINFDRIQNIPIYILNILTILKIGALN
jgi:hypothetical protein